MGLLRSLRRLDRVGKEIGRDWDPGAQVTLAQQHMAAASTMLDAQTRAARAAADGIPATAIVVSVRDGIGMVNYQPIAEIELTVLPEGGAPYPVTVRQALGIPQLGSLQPGTRLSVRIDRDDPTAVWLGPATAA
jgi:hypothetical protein